ncbi:MAG: hypothetical protein AAFP02_14850, partial [Bacteroidota bacterium]
MLSSLQDLLRLRRTPDQETKQPKNAALLKGPQSHLQEEFLQLVKEIDHQKKVHNQWNVKWSDLAAFQAIKQASATDRKELFFGLITLLADLGRFRAQHNVWIFPNPYYDHTTVAEHLLQRLAAQKLAFCEADYEKYFLAVRSYQLENARYFGNWPHNLIINWLKKYSQSTRFSKAFVNFLRQVIEWEHWKGEQRHYWGTDLAKACLKLETIV